jgi:hypothetical protein
LEKKLSRSLAVPAQKQLSSFEHVWTKACLRWQLNNMFICIAAVASAYADDASFVIVGCSVGCFTTAVCLLSALNVNHLFSSARKRQSLSVGGGGSRLKTVTYLSRLERHQN